MNLKLVGEFINPSLLYEIYFKIHIQLMTGHCHLSVLSVTLQKKFTFSF